MALVHEQALGRTVAAGAMSADALLSGSYRCAARFNGERCRTAMFHLSTYRSMQSV